MPVMDGLNWTFDTAASLYERMRPGYVDALYQKIFDAIPLDASSCALEIGIGGGQATLPILQTGCRVTAVEYGTQLTEICREKFRDFPTFSAITGKFEEVSLEENAYDLVFSASAFHWVPEEIGYPKVYSILKSGGVFARFSNHPYRDKGNPALSSDIDQLYRTYYDTFHKRESKVGPEYRAEWAAERAAIAEKYGFINLGHFLFYRTRTFTAKEYTMLLGTYSDHIAIDEPIRTEFFTKVEEVIDRHGGTITIYDTIELQLARKP